MRRLVVVALFVALACGPSAPVTPLRTCALERPTTDGTLHADGRALRDSLGRVVLLRGVNAGGRSKFAPFMPFDFGPSDFDARLAAYLDHAKAWGIDVLRVPFTWEAVEPTEGTDDEAFLKRYDALVDGAWARGLWTIVDLHQDLFAAAYCGDGFPSWTLPAPAPAPHHDCPQWQLGYFQDPAVVAAFDEFWKSGSPVRQKLLALWDRMAKRYANRPGVVGFEPFNEPSGGSADPGAFEATTLRDFYAEAIARIHAVAPKALVFVDPIGTDGAFLSTTLPRPAGDGVVFAPHFYPAGKASPDVTTDRMKAWADVGASWNAPVFVGELGLRRANPDAAEWLGGELSALDAWGLGGTAWEYSVAKEEWNAEDFEMTDPTGADYPIAKALDRPFARAMAGDGATATFDFASGTFTLRFSGAAGSISEIATPTAWHPSSLEASGACVDSSQTGTILVRADGGPVTLTTRR